MRKILLGVMALLPFVVSAQYSGKVFVDTNNNGTYDAGEKLLKDIRVSDGLNVVETNSKGEFTLPGHEREKFIFITLPSGYKAVHDYYRRIDKNVNSYDFPLVAYNNGANNKSFKFIQITDTEIGGIDDNESWAHDLFEYALNEKVAFIIHTGDICYENGLKAHIKLVNTPRNEVPVFYCIGNHDLVKGKTGEDLFEEIYGPVFYSFDVENVHYIVTPMKSGDYAPSYTVDEVASWMKNDLAHVEPGTPIIVFNHDLLTFDDNFVYGSKDPVDLNQYNLKGWIYGHWHINQMKKQGKVTTVCTSTYDKGGIDHSTNTLRVFTVDGKGDFSTDIRFPYIHSHLCIASPFGKTTSETVTVNTYSSVSPTAKVVYSCLYEDKEVIKDKALTPSTDWTWSGKLDLDEKYYNKEMKIRVVVEFANGERCVKEDKFKLIPNDYALRPSTNWTNLAGNAAHTGAIVPSATDHAPALVWTSNVGANIFMTSPVVYEGKVFVASVDEDLKGKAHVYALDAKNGKLLWKHQVEGSIKNTIAVDKGKVFAQDVYGHIYALNCNDGSLCWTKDLKVTVLPSLIEGLATKDGILYAGTGEHMMALNAENGQVIWQNKDWYRNQGAPSTLSVSDEMLIGSTHWGALYGNDAKTGKMLWKRADEGLRFRASSPAIHDGLLYLVSDRSFFILSEKTGETILRRAFSYGLDGTSTPLLTDDAIIVGTSTSGVLALDRKTLNEKWRCPVGQSLVYTCSYTRPHAQTVETSPVLVGNTVYVTASDGCLYGIDKNSGKVMSQQNLGAPIFSSVAVSGNMLFVSDYGGNVYGYYLKGDK